MCAANDAAGLKKTMSDEYGFFKKMMSDEMGMQRLEASHKPQPPHFVDLPLPPPSLAPGDRKEGEVVRPN